jgi:hypothetical protein
VVDDLGAAHRCRERLGVEDVAADGLSAQVTQRPRAVVGPGDGLDLAPVREEALDDRPAEEPRSAGDEDGVRQLVPLQVMLPHFWFASTKPECALRRAKAGEPW